MQELKTTSHIGHLIMTCLTGGLWMIVWLFCGLITNNQNKEIKESNRMFEFYEKRNHEIRHTEMIASLINNGNR